MTDMQLAQYITSMGLSIGLAVYIAFRAGRRVRGLTPDNFEEKLSDFAFDSIKELICNILQDLLQSQDVHLPAGTSIQEVAAHLHGDIEELNILQNIYHSLIEHGVNSPYYIEAVAYIAQLIAGG